MTKEIFVGTIFFALSLTSCGDCMQTASGTVLDSETKKPIPDTHVYKEGKSYDNSTTDSTGHFEIESISGGLFGCPGMNVVAEKDGYEKQTTSIDNCGHETIYLKKLDNKKGQ